MKSKLWYLTNVSLKKKMKTKWFVAANLVLLVLIVGFVNIDSIIGFFGGDFNEDQKIIVLDETNQVTTLFEQNVKTTLESVDSDQEITVTSSTEDIATLKEEVKENKQILIVFSFDEENMLEAQVISKKNIPTLTYQLISQSLNATKQQVELAHSSIDPEELARLSSPIQITREILDDQASNQDENMQLIMTTVFPTLILPIFMLVIFLVQMIGAEINEEKSTRSMEIIISNVSPKTHFFSKILSANIFVISQALLLLFYAGIALLIRSVIAPGFNLASLGEGVGSALQAIEATGIVAKLGYIIPLALVLLVLSFLAYSLVAGILASMTVNMEDFQQIQTPIMFICLAGYFLAIMSGLFDGSILIRILSYVPFISCLLSPALLVIGQIGIIDIVISIIVLALFNWWLIHYGLKIYKVGILNYSQDKMWSRLFKAAKEKK